MTGGVVPLAVTLASEAVFEAFVGESKVDHFVQLSYYKEVVICIHLLTWTMIL